MHVQKNILNLTVILTIHLDFKVTQTQTHNLQGHETQLTGMAWAVE